MESGLKIRWVVGSWKYLVIWTWVAILWWAFAFFPLRVVNAEWLMRARSVCFGLGSDGLPDSGGWILLTFAPISFLVAHFAIFGRETWDELKESVLGSVRRRILGFSAIALLLLVAWSLVQAVQVLQQRSILTTYQSVTDQPLPENYPRLNKAAPKFKLTDQFKGVQSLEKEKGNVVLVVFAFAHCSSICPGLVYVANSALAEIKDEKMKGYFITLDPERDTPSSLPSLAKRWQLLERSYVLSGQPKKVHQVLDQFQIPRTTDPKNGEVVHPAVVAMIDKTGKIAYFFNNPSKKWIVDAADRLLKE